jgi:hypothetical protein
MGGQAENRHLSSTVPPFRGLHSAQDSCSISDGPGRGGACRGSNDSKAAGLDAVNCNRERTFAWQLV